MIHKYIIDEIIIATSIFNIKSSINIGSKIIYLINSHEH